MGRKDSPAGTLRCCVLRIKACLTRGAVSADFRFIDRKIFCRAFELFVWLFKLLAEVVYCKLPVFESDFEGLTVDIVKM